MLSGILNLRGLCGSWSRGEISALNTSEELAAAQNAYKSPRNVMPPSPRKRWRYISCTLCERLGKAAKISSTPATLQNATIETTGVRREGLTRWKMLGSSCVRLIAYA